MEKEYIGKIYSIRNNRPTAFTSTSKQYFKEVDELDIGELPKYNTCLTGPELLIYNMKQFTKFKIKVLLSTNLALKANLNLKSTLDEAAYINQLKRINNKKIKEYRKSLVF